MSAVILSDDTLVIETPERVPLHFALASIGNRFLACAIDHTIQIVALITVGIIFAIITDAPDIGSRLMNAPEWVIALLVIIQFLIFDGYFAVFEWVWRGQTPGKRWLKLRVIREDGRPISFFEAMIRNRPGRRHRGRARTRSRGAGVCRSLCFTGFRCRPAANIRAGFIHRRLKQSYRKGNHRR